MDSERQDTPGGADDEPRSFASDGGDPEERSIPLEPESEPETRPERPRTVVPPARAKTTPETPKVGDEDKPLVREGLGGPKAALIAGAALLVGAMIAAAIRIGGMNGATLSDSTLAVFYVLFNVLLHTMTGFAALLITAKVAGRAFGRAELGAARMLVAVGAFALVVNLSVPIPGRIDEYLLAGVAYTLVVWGANRLSRLELGVVVTAHALILIVVALGSVLDGAYANAIGDLREARPAAPTAGAAP